MPLRPPAERGYVLRLTYCHALVLALILSFTSAASETRSVKTRDAEPRVVSLSPALTEIIFHLGKGDALVGRTDVCDYPSAAAALPSVGGFGNPALEKIIRLRPTAVVANDLVNPAIAHALTRLGVAVYWLPARHLADYEKIVAQLGDLLDARAAAAQELARVAAALQKFRALPPLRKSALFVIWDAPLMVAGRGALADEILQLAGIKNIAGDASEEYFKCSFDWALRRQPDFIVWTPPTPLPREHFFWRELTAVQNGRVIDDINPDLISRLGPRIFAGIEALRESVSSGQ
ncbi:MAG: helical backbone metal receptor [Planctomycetota bacterium]|jgi:iron complex transport system substrate-binding protein|nr:helical backbone metal receptor [Planctomycetota bacterium]